MTQSAEGGMDHGWTAQFPGAWEDVTRDRILAVRTPRDMGTTSR